MFMYMYDSPITIGISILSFIVVMWAQGRVTSAFKKYSKVRAYRNYSGYDVARKILDANGLHDVDVVETRGQLTDHYDPRRKVVRLSTSIYKGNSIASVSVAAHEVGHAIQDKESYSFMRLRHAIIPMANIGSKFGFIAVMIGLFMGNPQLASIGIVLLLGLVFFQLVTLPVEFNASSRAIVQLEKLNLIDFNEKDQVKKMLGAAALTYVAALAASILNVLRLALIVANSNRD